MNIKKFVFSAIAVLNNCEFFTNTLKQNVISYLSFELLEVQSYIICVFE